MPYNLKERRPEIDANPLKCQEEGDLAYVFAKFFWDRWNKKKSWATYHKFRKMLKNPGADTEYQDLQYRLGTIINFSRLDVEVAAELALDEFAWRVIRKYEDGKRQANGDVFVNEIPKVEVKS